jgi:hypothetical protein
MCEAVACLHRADEKSLQFHVFFYCAVADVLLGTELVHCTATDLLICGCSHLLTHGLAYMWLLPTCSPVKASQGNDFRLIYCGNRSLEKNILPRNLKM